MVMEATRDLTQQLQHIQHVQTTYDDALKSNTDCVRFLVSSRNCKKRTVCEYRHSKNVQLNPKDCKYWLRGNCLNSKCPFRHLPLDNAVGMQTVSSVAKTGTCITKPCTYFQKGKCLRGNKCAFSHGQSFISHKFLHAPTATAPVSESLHLKNPFGVHVKCTNAQKRHQNTISESAEQSKDVNLAKKRGVCLVTGSPKQLYKSELRQRLLKQKDRQMEMKSSVMKELELRQLVRVQFDHLVKIRGCLRTSIGEQLEESVGSTHGNEGCLMASGTEQLLESELRQWLLKQKDLQMETASSVMKELELRQLVHVQLDHLMKMRRCLETSSGEQLQESVGSMHGNEGCLITSGTVQLLESELRQRLLKQKDLQMETASSVMKELEVRQLVRVQLDHLMKMRGCLGTSSGEQLQESVGSTHGNEGCLMASSTGQLYESELRERLLIQKDQHLERSSIMCRSSEHLEESDLRQHLLKRRKVDVLRSMPAVFK